MRYFLSALLLSAFLSSGVLANSAEDVAKSYSLTRQKSGYTVEIRSKDFNQVWVEKKGRVYKAFVVDGKLQLTGPAMENGDWVMRTFPKKVIRIGDRDEMTLQVIGNGINKTMKLGPNGWAFFPVPQNSSSSGGSGSSGGGCDKVTTTANGNTAAPSKNPSKLATKKCGGGSSGSSSSSGGGSSSSGGSALCIADGNCVRNATPATLQSVMASAQCGCKIKLSGGTYPGPYTYNGNCTKTKPLVVESQGQGSATLTGSFNIAGNGLVLGRLNVIENGKVYITGNNNRVMRNRFAAKSRGAVELLGASDNEIDHNDFIDTPGGSTHQIITGWFADSVEEEVKRTHIHHNYFVGGPGMTGEHSRVYLGVYASKLDRDKMLAHGDQYTLVEYNIFDRISPSIKSLHIKSNRNTVQYNYLKGAASMDVRQGQYNTMKGNYVDGGGGNIAAHEEYNKLLCNTMCTGKVMVFAGEGGITQFGTYQAGTAKDTLVSGNVGTLELGSTWGLQGKTTPDEPALRTEVRGHSGQIIQKFHKDSSINAGAAAVCTAPTAPPVEQSQVGTATPCN